MADIALVHRIIDRGHWASSGVTSVSPASRRLVRECARAPS
jgi:hypothetical protein